MPPRKLLARIVLSPTNIRFADVRRLVEAFGFRLARVSGSHHIFKRDGVRELLNVQNYMGEAKPYQIRQFLELVERYNLHLKDDAE